MNDEQSFSFLFHVLIPILTTILTYIILHFVLKNPRINESLKILGKTEQRKKRKEFKSKIGELCRFVSDDLKKLTEWLESKKWDRYVQLIADSSNIFKDISYYLKLYDSELDSDIVHDLNNALDFFNDSFIVRDKKEREDKNLRYDKYFEKHKDVLCKDWNTLKKSIEKILHDIKAKEKE